MNIFYDYQLDDDNEYRVPPMAVSMLKKLVDFIAIKLSVLSEDITNEEVEDEEGRMPFILIRIMTDPKNTWGFFGYSDTLKERMYKCFIPEDWVYINNELAKIEQSFLN